MDLPPWAISILGTLFLGAAGLCWTLFRFVGKRIGDDIVALGDKIDDLSHSMTNVTKDTNDRISQTIETVNEIDKRTVRLETKLDNCPAAPKRMGILSPPP